MFIFAIWSEVLWNRFPHSLQNLYILMRTGEKTGLKYLLIRKIFKMLENVTKNEIGDRLSYTIN